MRQQHGLHDTQLYKWAVWWVIAGSQAGFAASRFCVRTFWSTYMSIQCLAVHMMLQMVVRPSVQAFRQLLGYVPSPNLATCATKSFSSCVMITHGAANYWQLAQLNTMRVHTCTCCALRDSQAFSTLGQADARPTRIVPRPGTAKPYAPPKSVGWLSHGAFKTVLRSVLFAAVVNTGVCSTGGCSIHARRHSVLWQPHLRHVCIMCLT